MKTIRRIYFYLVAVVSLEVVVWALINLARSMIEPGVGVTSGPLAQGLAFILVGLPVFLIHWRVAQREAADDMEERFSGTRALFLYAAWVGLGVPVVHSLIAVFERLLAAIFDVNFNAVAVGGYQTWADNLVSILVNSLLAAYVFSVIRADWAAKPRGEAYALVRRIQRFFWMLYGLGLVYFGANQLLSYLFEMQVTFAGENFSAVLVDGLSFSLAGAPLWVYSWRVIQRNLEHPDEHASRLRLWVFYLITLFAALTTLISTIFVLDEIFTYLFDVRRWGGGLLSKAGNPLSFALPALVVWGFYGRALKGDIQALKDSSDQAAQRRPYFYLLSLFGLVTTFISLDSLAIHILEECLDSTCWSASAFRDELSGLLAALFVGMPVLLAAWRPVNIEAKGEGSAGEQARRSVVRRGYLYLVLFAGVMGIMTATGFLIFTLLEAALGSPGSDFLQNVLQIGASLLLFAAFSAYHWRVLRGDIRLVKAATAARQGEFLAAVFEPGEGPFTEGVLDAMAAECPDVQTAVHRVGETLDKSLLKAGVAILPASLLADPPKALRSWLARYEGPRLVVPDQAGAWVWVGVVDESGEGRAKRVARLVRRLADGEALATSKTLSPGMVVGYVFGGLVGIWLLCVATTILMEGF